MAVSEFLLGSEVFVGPALSNGKIRATFHASEILGFTKTDSGAMSTLFPEYLERCKVR